MNLSTVLKEKNVGLDSPFLESRIMDKELKTYLESILRGCCED